MKTDQEKIEVMQAHLRGEKIQARNHGNYTAWMTGTPLWNWANCDYRIAPREPRRIRAVQNDNGTWFVLTSSHKAVGAVVEFVEVLP